MNRAQLAAIGIIAIATLAFTQVQHAQAKGPFKNSLQTTEKSQWTVVPFSFNGNDKDGPGLDAPSKEAQKTMNQDIENGFRVVAATNCDFVRESGNKYRYCLILEKSTKQP